MIIIANEPGQIETPAEPTPNTRITKRAFILRLTEKEYIDIDLASRGDTPQAAKIRRFIDMFKESPFFDIGLPENRTSLAELEAVGLFTVGRASIILDAPIQPHEEYR